MNMHVSVRSVSDHATLAMWDKTLAERDAAKRALEHHNAMVYYPLIDGLERISPRPELYFEIEALSGQVTRHHLNATDLHTWDDHWSPVYRRKAAEVRDAWLTYRGNCERLGTDAAGRESDRLCDAQCAIESTLIQMPAPDPSALLWKLQHLFGPEARGVDDYSDGWCAEWINAVMDDARHFMGKNPDALSLWSTPTQIAA